LTGRRRGPVAIAAVDAPAGTYQVEPGRRLAAPSEFEHCYKLEPRCFSCGRESSFDDVIEAAVGDLDEWDTYVAMTDGGDRPTATCHGCGKETFILDEGKCVTCYGELKFTVRAICSEGLGPNDQDNDGLRS
jgi:hypothetical protein